LAPQTPANSRLLLVDDHYAWRQQISSFLRDAGGHQVVGEAPDGMSGIDMAAALEPDVILLDVALPDISGLEVARRVLARAPQRRILFVSLQASLDIVEAGFAIGARGYVLKSDAESLLSAVDAVNAGRHYLSATLTGRQENGYRCHEIGFYDTTTRLLAAYARVGAAALESGKAFIFIGTSERRAELRAALETRAADVPRAIRNGRYIELDLPQMLSSLVMRGAIDEEQFRRFGTALYLRAAKATGASGGGVDLAGDGCATLLHDGNVEVALRLEQLWDEWAIHYNAAVLCGYAQHAAIEAGVARRIHAAHSAVHV
jgi:DNA-binding NarL/FixJ family response regulator